MRLTNVKPNFNRVDFADGRFVWFSYQTPIAFGGNKGLVTIRQNDWSTTTGRHLNHICSDKTKRIPGDKFEQLLAEFLNESPQK